MSKILIIEDEEAIADLEKDYLELSGFEVEIANRGDVGLEKALKEEYDLIILDLMLPEVDGFDICRQVRQEKNIPIIMVSAKKDDIDKIRGLGLGADDYMTKPFSPSELVARVKAHMERYNRLVGSVAVKNDIIEIRGIKIDKTARRIWVNGEEKTFTTKEFDLLTFLAENPNRVFTKAELFRQIWDMESVGDIATVTVHIKKIREKIEFNNHMEKLYKKLESYGQSDYYPFHMPGHKRNPDSVRGDFPFERDITEIEGFDNLHHPEDILLEAQKNVSKLYGTKESYYSVNGSTAALLAAVSAAVPRKGQILVARNCHKAVYHAMYLRELNQLTFIHRWI